MIQHILKIIWTERKINLWILFELILVFCIMWFCVDYISFFMTRYFEPKGYSIEHVYSVYLGVDEEGAVMVNGSQEQKDSLLNTIWTIADRIKRNPDIEAVSLSYAATPYSNSYTNSLIMLDSVKSWIQIKTVTPDFLKVFDIAVLQGNPADWDNRNSVFISGDKENMFSKKDAMQVKSFNFTNDNENIKTPVSGVVTPSKLSEFEPKEPVIYYLFAQNKTQLDYILGIEICMRVKAGADKDFISRFTKNMQEQISIAPFFLSSVNPMSDLRKDYLKFSGYDNNFKSIFAISAFLFINIFLAIVGTFWFRIQTRRSEIGLRVAMGSSKSKIKSFFIIETLILLVLASIISTPICINIDLVNIVKNIGVPAVYREENSEMIGQYIMNYCITFIILMLIAIAAVWYPSKKASEIQPAEALHYE